MFILPDALLLFCDTQAEAIHVHPFYLGMPVTIASSLSFILPASTSTNAIVYGKGRIKMNEMVRPSAIRVVAFNSCIRPLEFGWHKGL